MSYKFRREDNDEIIEVDFATAMSQVGGYITLPDGVQARRCVYLESHDDEQGEKRKKLQAEIVSDTLGVPVNKVDEYRENAKQYGYNVEFAPDPHSEDFCQARFPSWAERDRYGKFRGLNADRNSRNGSAGTLGPVLMERAKNRLLQSDA